MALATPSPGPSPSPTQGVVTSCMRVIHQADKAIADSKEAISNCQLANKQAQVAITKMAKDVQSAKADSKAFYRDPLVTVPFGAALAIGIAVNPLALIALPVVIIIGILR